jgi:hypothetical protein
MSAYFSRRRTFDRLYFPREMIVIPTIRYSRPFIQYRSIWDFVSVDPYRHNNAFNASIINKCKLLNFGLTDIYKSHTVFSKSRLLQYIDQNRLYDWSGHFGRIHHMLNIDQFDRILRIRVFQGDNLDLPGDYSQLNISNIPSNNESITIKARKLATGEIFYVNILRERHRDRADTSQLKFSNDLNGVISSSIINDFDKNFDENDRLSETCR